jgi:uncharacterized membrane protein YedE/YeeE
MRHDLPTEFTPLASALGGGLIGLSAVLLMLFLGRIMGATGILAGVITPSSRTDLSWRLSVLLGMATGPVVFLAATGAFPEIQVPGTLPLLAIGGLLVGIGVTLGGGCTSGHGVCGIARLSPRSITATLTFMSATAVTVYVLRHMLAVY